MLYKRIISKDFSLLKQKIKSLRFCSFIYESYAIKIIYTFYYYRW